MTFSFTVLSIQNPAFVGLIWVDALCINQGDHAERSKQVQLFGHTYKYAKRVIVWLGVEDDATEMAVELIRRFATIDPAVCKFPVRKGGVTSVTVALVWFK